MFCFDSLYLTEVIAEEVLSKLRGTRKAYLRYVENCSVEANYILVTFLPDDSFNGIISFNTLKTLILSKIDKVK